MNVNVTTIKEFFFKSFNNFWNIKIVCMLFEYIITIQDPIYISNFKFHSSKNKPHSLFLAVYKI